MEIKLTACFQKFPEGYAAFVEELPGANTQGKTLDEARENLKEAVAMVLQANRELAEESLRGGIVRNARTYDRMKRRDLLDILTNTVANSCAKAAITPFTSIGGRAESSAIPRIARSSISSRERSAKTWTFPSRDFPAHFPGSPVALA